MFNSVKILKGSSHDTEGLTEKLVGLGYSRREAVSEQGDFSLKGENFIVFPATFEYPVRIEFSGDTVERIVTVELISFKTMQEHDALIILPIQAGHGFKKRVWNDQDPIDAFVDIRPGDYVVHLDYGIGKYIGNRVIKGKSGKEECLALEYSDGDILYVSLDDLNKVQKYIYFHRRPPKLHKLGSEQWKKAKERTAKGIYKVANDILEVQAKRESLKGYSFSKDTDWQQAVEKAFPYTETPDQAKASIDVKADMESTRPMDRLLCGDVGYGKTEIALRAAFKAVMDNKQVAILVPTTILAEQHFNTFTKRFKDYPVTVKMLSRFVSGAEQNRTVALLKEGGVDVVIGTHRLLSKDIAFKDLGLVIIDEEQRFGVRHKEKLKQMRLLVDVLTLSATPIPRTLYMALMGGRDISIINTPPLERQPVETQVIEFDERIIKEALVRELERKGQVFFVHNRIDTIEKVAKRLQRLVPSARLTIGHGQMSESLLEKTMLAFINGKVDILVSTTIIESGIDIPNANTIMIDRAEHFGLADLYQLRGRVGRFTRKAHAYFIVSNVETLTGDEQRRLEAIKKFTELGAGFKVAMQDLELRGAGNILGIEQSGYIEQVGFDLYCRLLRQAIDEMK